jgi:hypothetical protein
MLGSSEEALEVCGVFGAGWFSMCFWYAALNENFLLQMLHAKGLTLP